MKGLGEKSFNFSKATNDIVLRNMQKFNTKKASQFNDVPTKYIKKFSTMHSILAGSRSKASSSVFHTMKELSWPEASLL